MSRLHESPSTRTLAALALVSVVTGPLSATAADEASPAGAPTDAATDAATDSATMAAEAGTAAVPLDAVTVRGEITKAGVPAAKTPQAITVLDRELLDRQAVRSVDEALRYSTGVRSELAARNGYEEFQIRGFSQSRYQFKDGLVLDPNYLQQQEAFGLERIEVLKGPASVLYGQVAPGGLVNLVSKLPTRERHGEVGLAVGSFGLVSPNADFSGTIDDAGAWRYRLSAQYSDSDDPIDFVGAKRSFVAPALTWSPSANTVLTVLAVYQDDEYLRANGLPAEGTIAPNPNGRPRASTFLGEPGLAAFKSPQTQIGYQVAHRVGDSLTVRQKFRRTNYESYGPLVSAFFGSDDLHTIDRFAFDYDARTTIYSLDNQAEGLLTTGRIQHRLLVGADYLNNRVVSNGVELGLGSIDLFAPEYGQTPIARADAPFFDGDNRLTEFGIYAQYRATLDEQFVAVIGQRYSDVRTDNRDRIGGTRTIEDDDQRTGNYALLWLAPVGFTPYLSYAESFRPQVGNDPLLGGGQPPPAEGRQVELGLKWRSPTRVVEGALALFDLRETNIVNSTSEAPGFSVLVGEQRHRGVELEGVLRPLPAVELRLGYAWLDAKITRSDDGSAGARPDNVPRHAATLFAVMGGAWVGLPAAEFTLGSRYVGDRVSDVNTPDATLPEYVVFDAGARYRVGRYTFGINARNLFDRRYYSGSSFGTVSATEPLTVIGSVKLAF